METLSKHKLKIQLGTVIVVFGFIIYWTFVATSQFSSMNAMINANQEQCARNKAVILTLQESKQKNEITLAEINVKLSAIEKTLVEIKQDLKK